MKKFLALSVALLSTFVNRQIQVHAQAQPLEQFFQIPATFSPIVGQLLNVESGYSPGISYGYISSTLCSNGDPQGGLKDGAGDLAWGLGLACNYQVTQTDVDNGYVKNVVEMIAGDSITVLASKTLYIWMTGTEVSYQLSIDGDDVDNIISGGLWKYNMTIYITNIGSRNISQISSSLGSTVMNCPSQSLLPNEVTKCSGTYVATSAQVAYALVNGQIPFTTTITTAAIDNSTGVPVNVTSIMSDYIRPLVILSANPSTFYGINQALSMSALVFGDSSSSISISVGSGATSLSCSNSPVRNCNFTYLTTINDLMKQTCLPALIYTSYNDKVTRQSGSGSYTTITRTTYVPYMRSITSSIEPYIAYVNNSGPLTLAGRVRNNGAFTFTFLRPAGYICDVYTLNPLDAATCTGTYTPVASDLTSGYAGLVSKINVPIVAQSQDAYGTLLSPAGTYTSILIFTLKLDSLSLSPSSSCVTNVTTNVAMVSLFINNSGATTANNLLVGVVNASETSGQTMQPSTACAWTASGFSRLRTIPCSFSYNVTQGTTISIVASDSTTNIVQTLGNLVC